MSDALITGLVTIVVAAIVGLPATLVAWGSIRNMKAAVLARTDEAIVKTVVVEDKANTIISQNEELKTLGNGMLSKLTSELSTANARIEGLERLISAEQKHGEKK